MVQVAGRESEENVGAGVSGNHAGSDLPLRGHSLFFGNFDSIPQDIPEIRHCPPLEKLVHEKALRFIHGEEPDLAGVWASTSKCW